MESYCQMLVTGISGGALDVIPPKNNRIQKYSFLVPYAQEILHEKVPLHRQPDHCPT